MIDLEQRQALVKAINSVVKNAVIDKPTDVESIPSGSILLDHVLGVGGYPKGRITEIFGGESAGKSTIALTLCANAQSQGLIPMYIDVENSVDFEYARMLGVQLDGWALSQPDNAEDAFRIAETAARNGSKLIIIDSIGAMVANRETEEESDIGDNQIGLMARIISKFIRRIAPIAAKNGTTVILINQKRAKIGGMPGTSTEDTPGGHVLKHGCSIRLKITRTGKETGDDPDFITSKVEAIKNKVAPPYRKDSIKILFGKGIDILSEIVQIGIEHKIIKKSGSWYKFKDENIGQGENQAGLWIKENPEVAKEILSKVENINIEFYMSKIAT